ncbi:MAG: prepilin-type N-terminal cleavage/methylation domain-containing protein [Spirochaetes bacterium]|nr:prepilin-type N-terminal cleavage/methylation domain-containing protein [Spirochaetota bacterium]
MPRRTNIIAARFRAAFSDNRGFTLLELIIVLAIVSIMTLLVAPRVSVFLSGSRSNFIILQSIVSKSFDDAFIQNRTNFLVIHMGETVSDLTDLGEKIFSRKNGVSVVNFADGEFRDSPNPLLAYREFPSSFRFEEVLMASGEKISQGNVLVPFYPQGQSDDVIVHILVNDEERHSMRISKFRKKPRFVREYITFDSEDQE